MNSRRSGIRSVALTATVVGSLLFGAACGSGASGGDGAAGEPVYGGTLTFLDPVEYQAFNITNTLWSNSQVTPQLVDRLTYQDPDTGEIEPWIAESWDISGDGLEYTFHLRDGVTFSDGTPLDAQAVKANYDQHGFGAPELGIVKDAFFGNYAGSDVVDDETVRVHLSTPNAGFLQVTSIYRSGLLAPSTLGKNLDEQGQIANLIGSGPFVLESSNSNQEIVLKRREDYDWAPPSSEHQGRAYLDRIVFKVVTEGSVRTGSLQSGQAHIARNIQPYDEELLAGSGIDIIAKSVDGETNHLNIHQTAPFVADKNLRLALQAATNRQEIVDTVLSPNYGVAKSILPQSSPWFSDNSGALTYDLDRAEQLLEDAGWKVGADGIRVKDGQRLSVEGYVAPFYQPSKATWELLAEQWKKAGVELKVKQVDYGTYTKTVAEKGQPFSQSQLSRAEPDVLRTSYDSTLNNVTFAPDPRLDELVRAQAAITDPMQRKSAVADIQKYLIDNAVVIPLYDETQIFAVSPTVQGFGTDPVARSEFYGTWLSEN
jgi:peptide/nickel transport system substrate-binding protein